MKIYRALIFLYLSDFMLNDRAMKTNIYIQLWLCAICILSYACKDDYLNHADNAKPIESAIYVSPEWSAESYPIEIPGAGNASFSLDEIPRWLKPDSKTGQLVNGKTYITCSAISDSEFSEIGVYNSTMKINVEGKGSYVMMVGYVNAGNPQIICPQPIELSYYGNTQISIRTQNDGILIWQIVEHPEWITVSDSIGTSRNNWQSISININPDNMPLTDVVGEMVIANNSVNSPFCVVSVKFNAGNPSFSCYDDWLDFGRTESQKNISISNQGNGLLTWKVEECPDWITVSPKNGTINSYYSENIAFTCNRTGLLEGSHTGTVVFRSNDKNRPTFSITVRCRIGNENSQNITAIEGTVIDAEYSKINNTLVYVTSDLLLNIYDPSSKITEKITLSYIPTCLSLSLNGSKAVVGHDGHVTYVDLLAKQIINTHDVSCNASDIVLGNNEWAYVFPKSSQWEYIRCINVSIANSTETLHTGNSIHGETKAKLHPSGKFIYGANNGLYPSDLEKYDIQGGTAVYLYDLPYHGDYEPYGDLWFSEDGNRIFTRGKNVFKTSEIREQDMLYNGSINLESNSLYSSERIMWLDHSEAKKNLYLISSTDDYWNNSNKPFIYIYNSDNLTFRNKIELEDYLVKDNFGNEEFYLAEPYFVFSNSNGKEIYAITKAIGSGLLNEWAIQTMAIE